MRTTLTLDRDVALAIDRLRHRQGGSFKAIVNQALRAGLRQLTEPPARRKRPVTRAVDLGICRLGNLDDVAEAVAIAEGEGFR
jgi:hypothetical protein